MNFKDYSVEASKTAIYDEKYKIWYPLTGLTGEGVELLEKVKKVIDDYELNINEEIIKECGDVFWYISALGRDLDIEIDYNLDSNEYLKVEKLEPRHCDILSETIELVVSLGKVGEIVKKVFRDKSGDFSEEKLKEIENLLLNAIDILNFISFAFGTTSKQTLQMNLEKLRSRQSRGVLSGSGDNR